MKSKNFVGKVLNLEKIENYNHQFLPDDYDSPCYRIIINDDGYEGKENCFYYLDVFIDGSNAIIKIEKNKDIYLTNYIKNRLPDFIEERSELILRDLTEMN